MIGTRTVAVAAALALLFLLGLGLIRFVALHGATDTLVEAAGRGDGEKVRAVLVRNRLPFLGVNADLRAPGGGPTALMLAAGAGHREIVRDLLNRGADVNLRDKQGRTALHYAREGGQTETVRLLREAGAGK